MKTPSVSIIIPVFNKCDLTVQCLAALAQVSGHIPHEVIVVDNASTDETPRRLRNFADHARVIRNETNLGFAVACNQGAASATSKLLLFLNNDTIPLQGWLEALLDEMRNHPEVAAAGAKLLYENGLVQHAGVAFARETRSPFHIHRLLRADDPRVNHRRELQAVTAACVLIRTKWFNQCGRFCEEFRNGYEDLDLCLNIRKQGGVIVYQPRSVVFHLESQTPGRMHFDNENRALFFRRWSDAILSDEDGCYFADGYRMVSRSESQPEQARQVRLASDKERQQWNIVARAQQFAAARRQADLIQELTNTEAWPADAAIRRWAGAVCERLNLREAARRHFEASLGFEDDAEVRLHLNLENQLPWAVTLGQALRNLRSGKCAAAHAGFETALLQGAPPRLVLPGWQRAAQEIGANGDAELAGQALRALPRVDSATAQRLEKGSGSRPQVPACASRTSNPPFTSVIILAFNQLDHTRKCLASIATCTKPPHEIIVVDNGSTDGTAEYLRQWQIGGPNRIVIRNKSNRGFAAGNNQGLSVARGDFLVLLNNDTVVTDGWLEGMLAVVETHPRTGVVGPMSNYVSGPQLVKEVGYRNLEEMPAFAARWAHENRGQSVELARAVGFCLGVKRTVIDSLGGLDEQFGSGNFEDDDFCIRARLAGFEIRLARAVFIHHTGSQTFKGARIDYRQAMQRNWDLFKAKWKMPADWPVEKGYRLPTSLPEGVLLKTSLPDLAVTHLPDAARTGWAEILRPEPSKTSPITLPACALAGQLAEPRELLRQKNFRAAWDATLATLARRPFHPEACLVLAEIALAAGDGQAAKLCAERARRIAPGFKPAKKFLNQRLKGGARPDWLKLPEGILNPEPGAANLSVCLIVKNEEKFLAQCLASIRGLARQIVVVDTGSVDRTVDIAKECGAEVHSFAWCDDFSAARNAALEHATGDWVLALDADEELSADAQGKLRKAMSNASVMAWRLPIVDVSREAEGCSYVPRLFRNAPGLFYIGRIHEQVFSSIEVRRAEWGLENRIGDATLIHHGYTTEMTRDRNKVERNLRLLERAIEELPGEPHLLMNLGLELARAGRDGEALERYQESFNILSSKPAAEIVPELRATLLTQLCTRLTAAKRFEEIIRALTSPLARGFDGLTASLHFSLGLAYLELKQFGEAADQMRQCLAKRGQPSLAPINQDIMTAAPHHCLALCLAQAGDGRAAEKAFQEGLKETGHGARLRLDCAKFLVEENRPVEALERLNEVVAQDSGNVAAWRLGGQIALSKPEFLEFAVDWTGEAMRHQVADLVVTTQRAEALMLSGDVAGAMELWESTRTGLAQPVVLAALILCEAIESPTTHAPRDAREEAATSRAFIEWYRKLLTVGAQATITRLNEQTDKLARALPTAAKVLEAAMAEADRAPAVGV